MAPKPPTPGLAHLLLGQPDLSEALMRGLALKGSLPQYITGELEPSVTVADLTGPEYYWLRRTTRLCQGLSFAGTAAQFSGIAFAPVANAGRSLAVLERVIIANSAGVAQSYFFDFFTNSLVGAAAGTPKPTLDDRAMPFNVGQPVPAFGLVNATSAAGIIGAAGNQVITVAVNQNFELVLNAVFTNRQVNTTPSPMLFMLQGAAVNQALTATFFWRERALLATEAS
jgi:hypothetical protein